MEPAELILATRPLPEPHLLVAPDGTILGFNPAAARALWAATGPPASPSLLHVALDPPERITGYLRACASTGSVLPGTLRLPGEGAAGRRYRCSGGLAVRGTGDRPPLVMLRLREHEDASSRFLLLNRQIEDLSREVRERIQVEEELQAQAAQLEANAAALEQMVELLELQRTEAQTARSAAEDAAQRLHLLAEAGKLLTATRDPEEALRALASLCTSTIADYCVTYLLEEDGSIRRVGLSHADPAAMALMERLVEQQQPATSDEAGAGSVIRTGEPVFAPQVTDEMLRAHARELPYLETLLRLAPRSTIIVPLVAGGTTLGAFAVATVQGGRRRYTPEDLAILQQLAGRAALLVAGARAWAELGRAHALLQEQARQLADRAAALEHANDLLLKQRQMAEEAALEAHRARAEAEDANRTKAQFLATMSHELRTPLNAIGGYVDLMDLGVHGPVTEAQRHGLDRIRRNQQHLLRLINDILNFARLEAGTVELVFEVVPLSRLLGNVVPLVETQLASKGVSYECAPVEGPVAVRGDEERIQQVLINLLSNATKFTPTGGRVRVDWSADEDRVSIRVTDNGRGIPADRLESIFDPFVQVDRSADGDLRQGVGLGLSISRDLARRMGGDLDVESREGEGSVFTLVLPRAAEDEASEAHPLPETYIPG